MAYLCWFALFDGLTSFQGDSGSYLLIARQWSPWFEATLAEASTFPLQSYPPVYPLVLALSGASHSLWLAHLLTVLSLATALIVFLFSRRHEPAPMWYLTLVGGYLLMPGTLYTSMGIMSENLFLLLLFSCLYLADAQRKTPQHWLILVLCLSLTLLTRTAGIALLPALLLTRPNTYIASACGAAAVVLLIGTFVSPLNHLPGYLSYIEPLSMKELQLIFRLSVASLPEAWQTYVAGPTTSAPLIALNWLSLGAVLFFTLQQASRGKLLAVFCLCYLLLLLVWPFPSNYRFLHAIILLMLVQPLAALGARSWPLYLIMLVPLCAGQLEIWQRAYHANDFERHSRDYYLLDNRDEASLRARAYAEIKTQMQASAQLIEPAARVATVKPTIFALLSQRSAVALRESDTPLVQVCELQSQGVDYLLYTPLTSGYNNLGLQQVARLADFTEPVAALVVRQGQTPGASLHRLKPDINCTSY